MSTWAHHLHCNTNAPHWIQPRWPDQPSGYEWRWLQLLQRGYGGVSGVCINPGLRTRPRCQQMDPIRGQRALCPLSAPKWIPCSWRVKTKWKLYDWVATLSKARIKSLWWLKFSCSQTSDWDPWRIIHRFYSDVSKCALRDSLDFTERVSEFTGLKDYLWPSSKAWKKKVQSKLRSQLFRLPTYQQP